MAIDIKDLKRAGRKPVDGRYVGVAVAIAVAFFVAYGYASAAKTSPTAAWAGNSASGTYAVNGGAGASGGAAGGGCGMSGGAGGAAGATGGGGGCCGGGSSTPIPGTAKEEGGVQKITVDTSSGGYSPNEITLKAGVPTEITFPPSGGCLGSVIFPDAGIQQDLSQGATIKLPAMQPGEYQFSCGMQMVTGKLIVK